MRRILANTLIDAARKYQREVDMQHSLDQAVDASSANMMWKAIDRNSQDYITLQSVDKVKFYKTPASILQRQMELYDEIIEKKSQGCNELRAKFRQGRTYGRSSALWSWDFRDAIRIIVRFVEAKVE